MKFGFFGINTGPCAEPETSLRVARAAEELGFDSVWTGEHVVLPDPQVPPSPAPPQTPMLDPAVSLAYLAAGTNTLLLGTGIIILPQRNAVELAKELASLDVVSGGRLLFGLGAGYLEPEFAALGASFPDRGARTDEAIDVLRELWTAPSPSFDGRFWSFSGIDAQPRPARAGGPPVIVGGMSAPALRRAVARGNGWYGFFQTPEQTAACLEGLEKARLQLGRDAALGDLEITITPPPGLDADGVRRYRDLGVDRLALFGLGRNGDELVGFLEESANTLLPVGA